MTRRDETSIAMALVATLISPNEGDRNGESANVVDGLFAIARAIDGLSKAVRESESNSEPDRQDEQAARLQRTGGNP
jgi:hypothetical protein